jgi:hypothetical protein
MEYFNDENNLVDIVVRDSAIFRNYIKDKPYIKPLTTLTGGYVITYVDKDKVSDVISQAGSSFFSAGSIILGLLDNQPLESAGIIQVQKSPYLNLRGDNVLIGIIDTGIDYTLDVFRYEGGASKIVGIYDQTATGAPPYDFSYGVEYDRARINEALRSGDPLSIVPETDSVGHGTFLASVFYK